MRYKDIFLWSLSRFKAIYQGGVLWGLAIAGFGLILFWWTLLPSQLHDIPQEGKAERVRQLEIVMAGLSRQGIAEEEADDAAPVEISPKKGGNQESEGRSQKDKQKSQTENAKKDAPPHADQAPLDPIVKAGMKVYKEFECFNCHKIAGKGWKKRKGPELDNIGNLVSADLLKKKLLDPFVFSTEGFEKEYQKPVMPNNYPKLMTEKEMDAVVAYMMTLKNPAAKTPKPVFDPKRPDL